MFTIAGSAFKLLAPRVVSKQPKAGWRPAITRILNCKQLSRDQIKVRESLAGVSFGSQINAEVDRLHMEGKGKEWQHVITGCTNK